MRQAWVLIALLVVALAGCRNNKDIFVHPDPPDISGLYHSVESVPGMERLALILWLREEAIRTYDAQLVSLDLPLEESLGAGTVGNDHLILNFEIRTPDHYYFQGHFNGGHFSRRLAGTFIFPRQPEQLTVEFERIADAPPRPGEDEDEDEDEDGDTGTL